VGGGLIMADTQILTLGTQEYTALRTRTGSFIMTGPKGAMYIIANGIKPLDPARRYYATSLTGGRMTYRGNPRLFTVDAEGNLVLA
jgi:hypothetical protein